MMEPRKPFGRGMTHPAFPERICWGCARLCAAGDLGCANGSIRTPHPIELFGDDWDEWFARDDAARDTDVNSQP